jgi:hypothetical protein
MKKKYKDFAAAGFAISGPMLRLRPNVRVREILNDTTGKYNYKPILNKAASFVSDLCIRKY